jgi:hypothetical protein
MGYLVIELARTIDEDRYREAKRYRRTNRAPALLQRQPTNRVRILAHRLQSLAKRGQRIVTEQQARPLAELS